LALEKRRERARKLPRRPAADRNGREKPPANYGLRGEEQSGSLWFKSRERPTNSTKLTAVGRRAATAKGRARKDRAVKAKNPAGTEEYNQA